MIQSLLSLLFFIIIGLFPFGQFERIPLPFSSAVYLHELVIALFVILVGIRELLQKRNLFSFLHGKLFFPWAMVISWILLSICLMSMSDPVRAVIGMMYLVRLSLYLIFARAIFVLIQEKIIPKKIVPYIPLIWGMVIALLGWIQYLFIPDTRGLALLGWDNHYFRLISTFFDPGFTGIILACSALCFQLRLEKQNTQMNSKLYTVGFLVVTSALLLTYSRASFVAYALSCIFLAIRTRKIRHVVLLGAFGACLFLLPRPRSEGARLERTASITSRVETFSNATKTPTLLHFFIGNGWYADKPMTARLKDGVLIPSHASAPENSYLFVYHALGIIGVGVVAWAARATLRVVNNTTILSVVLAVGAHALFTNTFFYPFILFLLGIVMASSARVTR